ncbi:hypothetical protein [Desulfolucanica intricata]|uniref:hypothetical protein n=1 Tax=Desulfolucanica intricata TaxID=1285191 RepID=UPI00082C41D1|nr:hypothetical protein [Desulfolucanica intricata]
MKGSEIFKDKNIYVPPNTDLKNTSFINKVKLCLVNIYNTKRFENVSFAASAGCIGGLIYGSFYFGHVLTGLLGLVIGGGVGYILDNVLPENES